MPIFKQILSHSTKKAKGITEEAQHLSESLLVWAAMKPDACLRKLETTTKHGLSQSQITRKRLRYGKNEVAKEKKLSWPIVLIKNFKDPLSLLLITLALISMATGDRKATVIISVMVILSVFLRFFQELRANAAAQKLKAMVHTTTQVIRHGKHKEISLSKLVPGDIVHLSAGDMVPADMRIIESKDLFISQSALTGESLPAEKHAELPSGQNEPDPLQLTNLCFLGTNVENGTAIAVVINIGKNTYLGAIAKSLTAAEPPTNFDIGIKKFTWLIMKFILIMVPAVFLLNGISRGNWFEAFIFALAVAVGITPEMLPMIVAVNLSKGAMSMARKKVIVKHLDSIQNFGAMDILCTDKTGTITEGRVVLEKYLDINGVENIEILKFAFLNSFYQTGLNNLLDAAILKHHELKEQLQLEHYKKIDEVPFDFARRRMSVIVEHKNGEQILICKGAAEEVSALCARVSVDGKITSWKNAHHKQKIEIEKNLNKQGFRVMAVAYKNISSPKKYFSTADENNMTLLGFLAFLDPPKAAAGKAITILKQYGINIKVLTGDNELVAENICQSVGLDTTKILLGTDIENMGADELGKASETVTVFAKLTPAHKEQIISALRQRGHAVGFMGDGINDAPALRAADVGISVDTAVDIAKESSDIILLDKDLLVLKDGVLEGRKIFGNVVKYIQMAASSNFGNMFSVVGGSIFLPFLPMLPIQILINNVLYDISQTAIPTDHVDEDYLLKPRQWDISRIRRFILYIGPISSIFDYATYFIMLYIFNSWMNPALFHTGWFIESLFTQTLIIHIIRTNKIPFLQSWASRALIFTTVVIPIAGIALIYSPFASALGFVPLPAYYWVLLAAMLASYFIITQYIKTWFNKKYREN